MKLALFLGLVAWPAIIPVASGGQTAMVASLERSPARSVLYGMRQLESALSALGWTVDVQTGYTPGSWSGDLEIVAGCLADGPDKASPIDPTLAGTVPRAAEGFAILPRSMGGSRMRILAAGYDPGGAMRALLELAGRISLDRPAGAASIPFEEIRQSPDLRIRAATARLFVNALADPFSWYYADRFWTGLLDTMAANRFNALVLEGAYRLMEARFDDVFPYLDAAAHESGVLESHQAEAALRRLNWISEMAAERGIQTVLMNRADGSSGPIPAESIAASIDKILNACPDLDGIGFRMNTDAGGEYFQEAYLNPLSRIERPVILLADPGDWEPQQARDLTGRYPGERWIRVPWNGDHVLAPYPVSGGRFAAWDEHTYQDFFREPREYRLLFHIRSSGSHRVFPWTSSEDLRAAVRVMMDFQADGFAAEPPGSPYPPTLFNLNTAVHDIAHYEWTHERDWFWYLYWGRLGYRVAAPASLFERVFEHRFGTAGPMMRGAAERAASVIPSIARVRYPSPDAREFSPELEAPPSIAGMLDAEPMDPIADRSIRDEAAARLGEELDGRNSPAEILSHAVRSASEAVTLAEGCADFLLQPGPWEGRPRSRQAVQREWKAWRMDFGALHRLAIHYHNLAQAAVQYGIFKKSGDLPSLLVAAKLVRNSTQSWSGFLEAAKAKYLPFPEPVRLRADQFHWTGLRVPWRESLRDLGGDYQAWLDGDSWRENLGHAPALRTAPGEAFPIVISVPPKHTVSGASVRYQNSRGEGGRMDLAESTVEGVRAAFFEAAQMTEGVFQYSIEAVVDGERIVVPEESAFRVAVYRDNDPPSVRGYSHEFDPSAGEVRVRIGLFDPSGVLAARLHWKPLPSDAEWISINMASDGEEHRASFVLPSLGAQYFVEALDGAGNAARYPSSPSNPPFRVVPPFEERGGRSISSPN